MENLSAEQIKEKYIRDYIKFKTPKTKLPKDAIVVKIGKLHKVDRIGKVRYDIDGYKMVVVKYNADSDMTVKYEDGHTENITYAKFKEGHTKTPYDKSVSGVGFIGIGEFKATDENNKLNKYYDVWSHMLMRCYKSESNKQFDSYKDCEVDEQWHDFQVFSNWYQDNFYSIENERMELDKDILLKGNKIYSPDNCIFVPQSINKLFIKRNKDRGKYPIGVTFDKRENKFRAECSIKGYRKKLGRFETQEEAFYTYKTFKEKLIKDTASFYKNKYPQFSEKLYNAMMNYKVEITD